MSRSVEDNRVLDEAEALLDTDARRERLKLVAAGLQGGQIQPVDHATARDQIEKRIRDRPHPVTWAADPAGSCGTESAGRARATC